MQGYPLMTSCQCFCLNITTFDTYKGCCKYSLVLTLCLCVFKVQGMSFIAAVLILNLDTADAFIAFANLLNKPCQMAFFRVDHSLVSKQRAWQTRARPLISHAVPINTHDSELFLNKHICIHMC